MWQSLPVHSVIELKLNFVICSRIDRAPICPEYLGVPIADVSMAENSLEVIQMSKQQKYTSKLTILFQKSLLASFRLFAIHHMFTG